MNQLVIFLFCLVTISISAQSEKTKVNCDVEMTKKAILTTALSANCEILKNKTITNFKVKVSKYKTVLVNGDLFNEEATNYISKANVGDKIVFFDIKVKTKTDEKIPPILITVIE